MKPFLIKFTERAPNGTMGFLCNANSADDAVETLRQHRELGHMEVASVTQDGEVA